MTSSTEPAPATDIALLFQRDPLSLTDEDRTAIISHYREKRAQFIVGDKKAGAAPKAAKEPKEKIKDLSDILNTL